MKALKIIGFIFAALGLAVFVFWFGWLRAPDAKDVCDNVAKIMKKENGVDAPPAFMTECVAEYSREPQFGRLPWVTRLKCLRDAETSDALRACEKR
jgi:hypothetical protein